MDSAILQELERIFFTGTEEDVRRFIKEKWEFLPQDVQDKIAVALMVDGIKGHVRDVQDVASFRTTCIEVLKALSGEEVASAAV